MPDLPGPGRRRADRGARPAPRGPPHGPPPPDAGGKRPAGPGPRPVLPLRAPGLDPVPAAAEPGAPRHPLSRVSTGRTRGSPRGPPHGRPLLPLRPTRPALRRPPRGARSRAGALPALPGCADPPPGPPSSIDPGGDGAPNTSRAPEGPADRTAAHDHGPQPARPGGPVGPRSLPEGPRRCPHTPALGGRGPPFHGARLDRPVFQVRPTRSAAHSGPEQPARGGDPLPEMPRDLPSPPPAPRHRRRAVLRVRSARSDPDAPSGDDAPGAHPLPELPGAEGRRRSAPRSLPGEEPEAGSGGRVGPDGLTARSPRLISPARSGARGMRSTCLSDPRDETRDELTPHSRGAA